MLLLQGTSGNSVLCTPHQQPLREEGDLILGCSASVVPCFRRHFWIIKKGYGSRKIGKIFFLLIKSNNTIWYFYYNTVLYNEAERKSTRSDEMSYIWLIRLVGFLLFTSRNRGLDTSGGALRLYPTFVWENCHMLCNKTVRHRLSGAA